ncbi:MAG: rsmE [Acidimicrobiales bacterium]|nr:rsmE [Acidimicrobiales bacterium]
MNPALRRSAAHVFVESLASPVLGDDDRHHLATVLRLRTGEAVSASDGAGGWRTCRFDASGNLSPDGEIVTEPPATTPITIGFALAKGDRPEWIVQKLTEIGVDHILVVRAERAIVRWEPAKADRQLDRLRKVAREASMQSRRVRLPSVSGPFGVDALDAGAAFAEPGGGAVTLESPIIIVGPEGGWTSGELATAPRTVSLGSTVLRVETAALVAAAQLAALRERAGTH